MQTTCFKNCAAKYLRVLSFRYGLPAELVEELNSQSHVNDIKGKAKGETNTNIYMFSLFLPHKLLHHTGLVHHKDQQ